MALFHIVGYSLIGDLTDRQTDPLIDMRGYMKKRIEEKKTIENEEKKEICPRPKHRRDLALYRVTRSRSILYEAPLSF